MGSSTSEVFLESSCEDPCPPEWKDGVKDSDNLACAAAGCGLSDVRSRVEDAHNRSMATKKLDVAGFAISLFAIWASSWEATPRQSYGFFRLEILGALLSIQLIWLLTGIIVYEAIYRMIHSSEDVNGRLMFLVATFGFFVNVIMVFLLGHHGHNHEDGHGHSHHGDNHAHGHASKHSSLLPSIEENASNQGYEDEHGHDHSHHNHNHHDHSHHGHNDDERHPLLETQEPRYTFAETDRRDSFKVDIDIKQRESGERGTSKPGNINVKGAWLHVLGDLVQSIGVMIGGAIIWAKPEWKVVDLICTLFFSVIVLGTTIKILRDIMEVLMESTPREIDAKKLEKGLCEIPGVIAIHDLHIWAITMGKTLLACHVTIYSDADADAVLQRVIGSHGTVSAASKVFFLLALGC
ncbi:hypothetical protein GOP47_0030042 [Adiantum capillus-veneris]|nr:hypothetical protein GOP47_0030042 [Adiantum capillus-veneris]